MATVNFGEPKKLWVKSSPLSDARPWDEVPIRECKSEELIQDEKERWWSGADTGKGKDISVTFTVDTRSKEYAISILRTCLMQYRRIRSITCQKLHFEMAASQYKLMQTYSHRAYNMNFERFLKAHGIKAKIKVFRKGLL